MSSFELIEPGIGNDPGIAGIGIGEFRIERDRLLVECESLIPRRIPTAAQRFGLQIVVVSLEVVGWRLALELVSFLFGQVPFVAEKPCGDARGQFVLDAEDIIWASVESLRPDKALVGGLDQLWLDENPGPRSLEGCPGGRK